MRHMKVALLLVLSCVMLSSAVCSPCWAGFTDIGAQLPQFVYCGLAWGDYDNDGDLDLAIAGSSGTTTSSKIYRNDSGTFVDIGASLVGVDNCSLAWGDYDNDGDLDLAIAGANNAGYVSYRSKIYRNDAGSFVDIGAPLVGVENCSLAWGDFDNDGDLDLAIAGRGSSSYISKIYRNDCGAFADTNAPLVGVYHCSLAWGDYDNDGDLDLALTGDSTSDGISKVYRNDGGVFADSGAALTPLYYGSVAWSDYDSDGDLDLALTGWDNTHTLVSRVFRNSNGSFADAGAGLVGVASSGLAWGDYDNDGDPDLVVSGIDTLSSTRLYRNNGGSFAIVDAGFAATSSCSLAWGDYDNDGDLDLAIAGHYYSSGDLTTTRVYRNDSGVFIDTAASLVGVRDCKLAWGDYDNDGQLDLAVSGYTGTSRVAKIYRNRNGTFVDSGVALTGASNCGLAWGDYDNDGDLDLALVGYTGSYISKIYRNDGGSFVDICAPLAAVAYSSLAWGDYDCDGDLDIALAGLIGSSPVSKIYRNDGGVFTDTSAPLVGVYYCSLAWADYDNDGDLDLSISGATSGSARTSKIYRNDGGAFADIGAALVDLSSSGLAWGDYDNDGDLDLAIVGSSGSGRVSKIYRNDALAPANTPPVAPSGLSAAFTINGLTISWNSATDAETPADGLTYNVRVGSSPGAGDIFSGMADASGLRPLPALGNAQKRLTWSLRNLPAKPAYYCSVQAIDGVYTGSAWSAESAAAGLRISGFARMLTGVPGVRVSAEGATYTTTDSTGRYELIVPSGWSGTVVPSDSYYRFTPRSRSYSSVVSDLQDQDFAASCLADIGAPLVGVCGGSLAWGDYDNDGDLDLAVSGFTASSYVTRVYRNDSGAFTDIGAAVPSSMYAKLAWGDYDNDGDLDLAIASSAATKVYRNDNGAFTETLASMTALLSGSLEWGDYDNDGDLDLAVAGSTAGGRAAKIYRNDNGTFVDIAAPLIAVASCSLVWGDYDNDGDLDLAVAGSTSSGVPTTKIYRNDSGAFADTGATLTGISSCSLAWGDYDNDGDLDLAAAGATAPYNGVAKVYRNDGGVFADSGASLPPVHSGSVAWGDYDNDGDLDLALAGQEGAATSYVTKIYVNDSGSFADSGLPLVGVSLCSLAWGDYDSDGDLDLAIAGQTTGGSYVTKIYRDDGLVAANTAPAAPTGLAADFATNGLTLSWDPAADAQTPALGLSYNIRVGSTAGGCDVFSGMASATGLRRLPALGSAQKRLTWTLKNVPAKSAYHCSVQAIDTAFAGSPWAEEAGAQGLQISGHVRLSSGLSGVTITASNASYATTDADGYYEIAVPSGWSGTLTATKASYWFLPPDRSYSNLTTGQTDQDLTACGFADSGVALAGVAYGTVAWGDYDNDGDLDLAVSGATSSGPISRIYRSDDGAFVDIGAALAPAVMSSLAWGDYDNDGDLDLALAGSYVSKVYRNDSGVMADTGAALTGVSNGGLAWGDYDNDGDLDLAISGATSSSARATKIYRNDHGSFGDIAAPLVGLSGSGLSWGDYDNDGDLDLALMGYNGSTGVSKIYRNDGGTFADIGATMAPVYSGRLAWDDYDNDGDLDLAMAGHLSSSPYRASKIYRNDSGAFTDIAAPLAAVGSASLAWGDYDNDGDLDIAIAGMPFSGAYLGKIYRNDNGSFADAMTSLPAVTNASVAWGDYDGDGDLDLAICGQTSMTSGYVFRIYRNSGIPNTPPSPPASVSTSLTEAGLLLSWSAAADGQTPSAGLSYNIRIGSSPGACDVFSGMAEASAGLRRLPGLGNAQKRLSWLIKNPPARAEYWCSVQAIDSAFAGSTWTTGAPATLDDALSPTIASVTATPNLVAAGDLVRVTVNATDNTWISSVQADGVWLSNSAGLWTGDIPAAAAFGTHPVAVVVTDAAANSTSDSSVAYRTARVFGIACGATAHPVMDGAFGFCLFRLWGKVSVIDSNSFWIDDGSHLSVKIISPGYAGIVDGDYVSACGILDPTANPPTLTCTSNRVAKLR